MSIELMNGVIPCFIYNIDIGWNVFQFKEDTAILSITLTPGLYSNTELCIELQKQLNAIPNKKNTYTVTFNPNGRNLQLLSTNTVSYSLLFFSGDPHDDIDLKNLSIISINTPARMLGFGLNDYISDSSGTIVAPIPMDLQNFSSRMYLHLESDGKNLSRMEVGAGRQDCFHIFYFIPGETEYMFLNKETDRSVFTSSPAPLSRITTLEISLRDEFNRPINMNHREVSLIFDITHLE